VHFSTDYVFSGEGAEPWTERSAPAPVNAYGRTKLDGERAVAEAGGPHLILRTSWVHSGRRANFVRTILRLAAAQARLEVVDDQWGAPTHAGDLADGALRALAAALAERRFRSGLYHLTNEGFTQRHELARRIIERARARGHALRVAELVAVPSARFASPARRPLNCRLSTIAFRERFGFSLPAWELGLERTLDQAAEPAA
jgi:dTDP-4-dehydrorhamnose reductase